MVTLSVNYRLILNCLSPVSPSLPHSPSLSPLAAGIFRSDRRNSISVGSVHLSHFLCSENELVSCTVGFRDDLLGVVVHANRDFRGCPHTLHFSMISTLYYATVISSNFILESMSIIIDVSDANL